MRNEIEKLKTTLRQCEAAIACLENLEALNIPTIDVKTVKMMVQVVLAKTDQHLKKSIVEPFLGFAEKIKEGHGSVKKLG